MFKKYHLSYFNRLISLQMYVLCIYIILEGTKNMLLECGRSMAESNGWPEMGRAQVFFRICSS